MKTGHAVSNPRADLGDLFTVRRALWNFLTGKNPALSFDAFSGLSALRMAALPRVRHFRCADGLTLGYRHYTSDSTVALVLVHGSAGFGDQFHVLARQIAASGAAEVYTLDMRGHGLSEGDRGHAVSHTGQIAGDVADFIGWLKRSQHHPTIVLGGHSAGGGVALAVSRGEAAETVDGYVFLAPYLGLGTPTARPHFGGWAKLDALRILSIAALNMLGIFRFDQRTVVDFNTEACLHDPRYVRSWSFATALAFGPGVWRQNARPISSRAPVLLLTGDDDHCFVPEKYDEALRVIAPHGQKISMGQCGHWGLLTSVTTVNSLGAWLERNFPQQAREQLATGDSNEAAA